MERILRELSIPYHSQSIRLAERSNQIIQDALHKAGLKDEDWDLSLPTIVFLDPYFHGMSSYEVSHNQCAVFTIKPQLP
jgi:hypothetical protein